MEDKKNLFPMEDKKNLFPMKNKKNLFPMKKFNPFPNNKFMTFSPITTQCCILTH